MCSLSSEPQSKEEKFLVFSITDFQRKKKQSPWPLRNLSSRLTFVFAVFNYGRKSFTCGAKIRHKYIRKIRMLFHLYEWMCVSDTNFSNFDLEVLIHEFHGVLMPQWTFDIWRYYAKSFEQFFIIFVISFLLTQEYIKVLSMQIYINYVLWTSHTIFILGY